MVISDTNVDTTKLAMVAMVVWIFHFVCGWSVVKLADNLVIADEPVWIYITPVR